MKIIFTKHSLDKFKIIEQFGWKITQTQVKGAIAKPKWKGKSRFGQATAMSLMDDMHILRVVFNREGGKIKVITLHIARRGKYESTI